MAVLSEMDGRALCYPAFSLVVPLRKTYKDGVNGGGLVAEPAQPSSTPVRPGRCAARAICQSRFKANHQYRAALGVQQMARRRAITRKLPSVETLGAVTTICSDKTGTLTKNEMTARMVHTRGARFQVSGLGYAPIGQVTLGGDVVTVADRPDLARLVEDMAICNDATVVEDGSQWRLVGEPTEGALSVLGPKAGFATDGWRRVAVVPFDPATKYMGMLARAPDGALHVLVKGAPDRILERCIAQTGPTGDPEPLDLEFWESQIDEIGARGLRVLAAAHACPDAGTSTLSHADLDGGLELAGLVGIVDPPRPRPSTRSPCAGRQGCG
jgi:magnesium-transporting ATPase (P-type)